MISYRSTIAAVLVAAVSVAASSAASADMPIHRVTGGGSAPTETEVESYGFQAQIDASGNVKGKAVFQFRPQDARFFGEITCLQVNGNEAWMGGELTQVDAENFPPLPIYFLWQVRDNGQGADALADQVSVLLLSLNPDFPSLCVTEPVSPVPLIDLENGNVQVD